MVTTDQLKKFFPNGRADLIAAIVSGWPKAVAAGITTPLDVQHFMANVHHETMGLTTIEENLNYRAVRLTQVWPQRFPTVASAIPYERAPAKLAEKVYNGRYGNTAPGDGWKYRGSGFFQTTFKANFAAVFKVTGVDVVSNPDILRTPGPGFEAACIYWKQKGISAFARKDDVVGVRKLINGGTNGLDDVKAQLVRAKRIFV